MKNIVIITWNGKSTPFEFIIFDENPTFKFILFDYSGNSERPSTVVADFEYISNKTEYKGEIYLFVYKYFKEKDYTYLGIIDDDIKLSVSSINKMLLVASILDVSSFQASLDINSFYSHTHFLNKESTIIEFVPWVEVMAPFYKKILFESAASFYENNISSYGLDKYVFPLYTSTLKLNSPCVFHFAKMKHLRPVTSNLKILSSGLRPIDEEYNIRKKVKKAVWQFGISSSSSYLKSEFSFLNEAMHFIKYNLRS
jgi:hypothetical protein